MTLLILVTMVIIIMVFFKLVQDDTLNYLEIEVEKVREMIKRGEK